ncbi:hypothetical protein BBP40_001495 [Aspergillus hancockii]|nr:hypothetical protein BBP40_001495 [Aspergillus hancockii]
MHLSAPRIIPRPREFLPTQVEKNRSRTIIRALLAVSAKLFLMSAGLMATLHFLNSACNASFISELSTIKGQLPGRPVTFNAHHEYERQLPGEPNSVWERLIPEALSQLCPIEEDTIRILSSRGALFNV